MVTSAVWSDYDGDASLDLIVVGEWMPITVFRNNQGVFVDKTEELGLQDKTGWWNKIIQVDIDNDGDMDYVAGNLGLNYKYKGTEEEPLHVYCHDFDHTGTYDIVLGYYNNGECYPVRGRQCSSEQMPDIKKKFPNYDSFGKATIDDVYGEELNSALHYTAKYFASAYIENGGAGDLKVKQLPSKAQFSTIFGIIPADFNGDDHLDLLIAGNLHISEVETGRADASMGWLLKGDSKGNFVVEDPLLVGIMANKDVRDLALIRTNDPDRPLIIVANNNDKLSLFRVTGKKAQKLVLN